MEIEYLCSMACVFTSLIQISYNFTFNKFGRLIRHKYLQMKNSGFMEVVLKLRNYIRKTENCTSVVKVLERERFTLYDRRCFLEQTYFYF